MRVDNLLALALLTAWLMPAQAPIGVNPVLDTFNWYGATPSGCTAGAREMCVGNTPWGDTVYPTAWFKDASSLPVTTGLPIVGALNDFTSKTCSGNVAVIQIAAFDWTARNASKVSEVNCLSDFNSGINAPPGWNGHCTSGDASDAGCVWHSRSPFVRAGKLYLPVMRQANAGTADTRDTTFIMSADGGATWKNPYTVSVGGSASAGGDPPLCGAAFGPGHPCTDASYPRSILWPAVNGNLVAWQAVQYGQDWGTGSPSDTMPAGVNDGCDPLIYTCFVGDPLDRSLMRVLNSDLPLMDPTKFQYYTCPALTDTYRCPGSASGSWSSNYADRTEVGPPVKALIWSNPVAYIKEFKSYLMLGGIPNGMMFITAPSMQGPWTYTKAHLSVSSGFTAVMMGTGYTVVSSNPPHVQVTLVSDRTDLDPSHQGTLRFDQFDLVAGKSATGSGLNEIVIPNYATVGAPILYSDSHAPGTIPRNGLVAGWDFADAPWTNAGVRDVVSGTMLEPCHQGVCGWNSGRGITSQWYGVDFAPIGYDAHLTSMIHEYPQTAAIGAAATSTGGLTPVNAPSAMAGNGTFTVAGIFRINATASNVVPLWSTGTDNSGASTMVTLAYNSSAGGPLELSWGLSGARWRFNSGFTPTIGQWYYVAVTVSANGATPTAHMWIGVNGRLVDEIAGVSRAATGGSPTQTPNVAATPLNVGDSASGTQGNFSAAGLWVYNRVLSRAEIGLIYRTQKAEMVRKGEVLDAAISTPTISVTNTQALACYTAPDSNPCTVEVSESPTYSPLVHDVDTTLFSGANSDSRATSIVSGTARCVVLGARKAELAGDAKYYSRALQTATQHYYRISCGGNTSTGTFTTANIPLGNTSNSPPAVDPLNPGVSLMPTILNDRSQTIIDTETGAQLSHVSLTGDQVGGTSGSQGVTIYDGASPRIANDGLVDDGTGVMGYINNLYSDVGWVDVYFTVPSTGEVRNLGWETKPGGSLGNDGYVNYLEGGLMYRKPYTGNYTDVGSTYVLGDPSSHGAELPTGSATIYSATPMVTLIKNFDSTFDDTGAFFCGDTFYAPPGKYISGTCKKSSQNSYGWVYVFYTGDGRTVPSSCAGGDTGCPRVVAAWYTYGVNSGTRYNGLHEVNMWKNDASGSEIIGINWASMEDFSRTDAGFAPVATTLSVDTTGSSTITVTGPLASRASGGDPTADAVGVAVGDAVKFRGYGDTFFVGSISGNNWTFTAPPPSGIPAGTDVYMSGNVLGGSDGDWTITLWDWLNDPHGADTTQTYIKSDRLFPGGGHYAVVGGVLLSGVQSGANRISESGGGWATYPATGTQTVMQSVGPAGNEISSEGSFNGVHPFGNGSVLTKHPSEQQTTATPWFADRVAFGGGLDSGTGRYYSANPASTLISGNLYQYFADPGWPFNPRYRKIIPTQATTGGKSLLDISSAATGDVIGTTSADNYKYCYAAKVNECRTGSAVGDIYFNVPVLTYNYCTGGDAPNPTNVDICITSTPIYSGLAMQFFVGADSPTKSRNLTGGLAPSPKFMFSYPLLKSLPDESYAFFTEGVTLSGGQINVWKVKLPPYDPDATITVDRSKFVPAAINLTAPTGLGVASAAIKFGYLENGTATEYYCTSRREACLVASATAPPSDGSADPFWFASETFAGVSCATSCTVTIPIRPGQIAYYQPVFYNAGGAVVATGTASIAGDFM